MQFINIFFPKLSDMLKRNDFKNKCKNILENYKDQKNIKICFLLNNFGCNNLSNQ